MTGTTSAVDVVVVGGGIVGLATARELIRRHPDRRILVLEKERSPGLHASGRNSGVLHSGIYYPPETMKAKFCRDGARAMLQFARENGVANRQDGKLIVACSEQDLRGLDRLVANAATIGISATRVSGADIQAIEPHANDEFDAVHCPETAVVDAAAVIASLRREIESAGVEIRCGEAVSSIDDEARVVATRTERWSYGSLLNTAGAYADRVARLVGVGVEYRLVPFKGLYYRLADEQSGRIRGSIYPVPDPALPFLGVHLTRTVDGSVYVGPTAIPALGRENYGLIAGAEPRETAGILFELARLYVRNVQGFRSLVRRELPNYRRAGFLRGARKLVDRLDADWLVKSPKVGIRPQLVNTRTGQLEMDFLLAKGRRSLHVLNAISPAFTSAFSFATYIADQFNQHLEAA